MTVHKFLKGYGIIEILRILGVNRDGEDLTKILSGSDLPFRNICRDSFCFSLCCFQEGQRKFKFGQDRLHLHLVIAGLSKNLDDFPERILRVFGPFADGYNHLLSVSCTVQILFRNIDIYWHRSIVRDHESEIFRYLQDADKLCFVSFDDLYDLPFPLSPLPDGKERDLNIVAMQGMTGVSGIDEYITRFIVRDHIGLPRLFHVNRSGHVGLHRLLVRLSFRIDPVFSPVGFDEFPVSEQLFDQQPDQVFSGPVLHADPLGNLLVIQCAVRILQVYLQNVLDQRIFLLAAKALLFGHWLIGYWSGGQTIIGYLIRNS